MPLLHPLDTRADLVTKQQFLLISLYNLLSQRKYLVPTLLLCYQDFISVVLKKLWNQSQLKLEQVSKQFTEFTFSCILIISNILVASNQNGSVLSENYLSYVSWPICLILGIPINGYCLYHLLKKTKLNGYIKAILVQNMIDRENGKLQ